MKEVPPATNGLATKPLLQPLQPAHNLPAAAGLLKPAEVDRPPYATHEPEQLDESWIILNAGPDLVVEQLKVSCQRLELRDGAGALVG